MRLCQRRGLPARGLDIRPGDFTQVVGSIANPTLVHEAMQGVTHLLHTATLHKPHVATHSAADFVETNVTGTLTLLEVAKTHGLNSVVFTSTTSAFGRALTPDSSAPAAWITEDVQGAPKNIYGATKTAAEDLCALAAYRDALPCVVLRTSRFFPEVDDNPKVREAFSDQNTKVNELLYRRVDIEDAADAHLLAAERAPDLGFARFIISANTSFQEQDVTGLRKSPKDIIARDHPEAVDIYTDRGWSFPADISRVYDSRRAQQALNWQPKFDFSWACQTLQEGQEPISPLAKEVGIKGYQDQVFSDGPYPVDATGV